MDQKNQTKYVTGKVRFSYANVWEPKGINGSEPKYSISILIPKSDTKSLAEANAAINAAIEAGKTKLATKTGQVIKAQLKLPLRDGDTERPDDPAYAGHYFFNANSTTQPGIVGPDVKPILDQTEFYSGCYGRASVNFYAFNSNGNKGIAAGLNNLQKLADGEALAGGSKPEDDFEAVFTDEFAPTGDTAPWEDDILG